MKVAIISSGYLPIPAVNGGAVETIIDEWIKINEEEKKVKFEIFSIFNKKALEEGKKDKFTYYNYIKNNKVVNGIDKIIYWVAKNILKKEKTMSYRYIIQRLYFLNQVSKKLKKNDYDKIILENHTTLFLALKWRKNYIKYDGKYYYHVHNEIKSNYGCTDIIKKSKKILCVSNYIKKHVEKHFNMDGSNIEILTNCVDINKFNGKIENEKEIKLKEKFNIKENEKILLFTGRLSKEKGIKELLQAIAKIANRDFKLLIVGSFFFGTQIKSDFQKELEELINAMKEKVVFTGYIPYEEIQEVYAIADIAVLPSIWNDPAPLTIIESMASGLPIITTDSGGIPEYAKNGCASIIKRDKDIVSKLAKEIQGLLDNDEKVEKMSEISKENAKILNLNQFYKDLIQKIQC